MANVDPSSSFWNEDEPAGEARSPLMDGDFWNAGGEEEDDDDDIDDQTVDGKHTTRRKESAKTEDVISFQQPRPVLDPGLDDDDDTKGHKKQSSVFDGDFWGGGDGNAGDDDVQPETIPEEEPENDLTDRMSNNESKRKLDDHRSSIQTLETGEGTPAKPVFDSAFWDQGGEEDDIEDVESAVRPVESRQSKSKEAETPTKAPANTRSSVSSDTKARDPKAPAADVRPVPRGRDLRRLDSCHTVVNSHPSIKALTDSAASLNTSVAEPPPASPASALNYPSRSVGGGTGSVRRGGRNPIRRQNSTGSASTSGSQPPPPPAETSSMSSIPPPPPGEFDDDESNRNAPLRSLRGRFSAVMTQAIAENDEPPPPPEEESSRPLPRVPDDGMPPPPPDEDEDEEDEEEKGEAKYAALKLPRGWTGFFPRGKDAKELPPVPAVPKSDGLEQMTQCQDLLQAISSSRVFTKALSVTVRNLQKLIVDLGSLTQAKLSVSIVQALGAKVQQWSEFEQVVKGAKVSEFLKKVELCVAGCLGVSTAQVPSESIMALMTMGSAFDLKYLCTMMRIAVGPTPAPSFKYLYWATRAAMKRQHSLIAEERQNFLRFLTQKPLFTSELQVTQTDVSRVVKAVLFSAPGLTRGISITNVLDIFASQNRCFTDFAGLTTAVEEACKDYEY